MIRTASKGRERERERERRGREREREREGGKITCPSLRFSGGTLNYVSRGHPVAVASADRTAHQWR
eukprot:2566551-Rhodomonas_salina.1